MQCSPSSFCVVSPCRTAQHDAKPDERMRQRLAVQLAQQVRDALRHVIVKQPQSIAAAQITPTTRSSVGRAAIVTETARQLVRLRIGALRLGIASMDARRLSGRTQTRERHDPSLRNTHSGQAHRWRPCRQPKQRRMQIKQWNRSSTTELHDRLSQIKLMLHPHSYAQRTSRRCFRTRRAYIPTLRLLWPEAQRHSSSSRLAWRRSQANCNKQLEKEPDLLDVHIGTNVEDEELQPVLDGNLRGMRTRIQMTRSMPHVGALARSFMASLTCHHHCHRWLYRSLPDGIGYRTSSHTRQDNRSSLNKRPPASRAPGLAGGSPPPSPRRCP